MPGNMSIMYIAIALKSLKLRDSQGLTSVRINSTIPTNMYKRMHEQQVNYKWRAFRTFWVVQRLAGAEKGLIC